MERSSSTRRPETIRADRDHVVLFSDWTDEDPMRVFAKLKSQGDYYNYNQPTVFDFFRDASRDGVQPQSTSARCGTRCG
jgi:FtsP/CotA-like multicopper oxidase with cupredoxin domain